MNFWRLATKVFAFFSLFFAISIVVRAQNGSSVYQLKAGTIIRVQMDNEINSKVSSAGDTFTATISAPVIVSETVVLPIGTIIRGRITKAKNASLGGRNGLLTILFERLEMTTGEKRDIEGILVNQLKAAESPAAKIIPVVGATAVGGVLGTISSAGRGTLIGAGLGAAAGTTYALVKKGKNVQIAADEEFEIKLIKDVTLPVESY